ncbi:uncharacterized protein LOC128960051 [Oppia nitens]|uniref:uncharacterized protein LOC128960051 n=1 Tax=Oppia nitens TaxID=1686743 RepID=UPI0023D9CAAD|nr:uncharacterized protein LOC128960051 [Oppia nitens]
MSSTEIMCFIIILSIIQLHDSLDTPGANVVVRPTNSSPPEMCVHSSRFDSITQFIYYDNVNLKPGYFFAKNGYYWILDSDVMPTADNCKGRLPDDFRADAAFFRMWKRCVDDIIVPMIVIVDSDLNSEYGVNLKSKTYLIHNSSWINTVDHRLNDPSLKHLWLYPGFQSVDAIINFSNIKVGPMAKKLGDESIFVMTSALNNTYYYDWVRLIGCLDNEFKFNGKAVNFFGGPLYRALWKMNTSVDAAMVYTMYPMVDPNVGPLEGDISLFQENSHYQFSVDLELVANGHLYSNNLITQYYSTWLECAPGTTPEPPIVPSKFTTDPSNLDEKTTTIVIKTSNWPILADNANEEKGDIDFILIIKSILKSKDKQYF